MNLITEAEDLLVRLSNAQIDAFEAFTQNKSFENRIRLQCLYLVNLKSAEEIKS